MPLVGLLTELLQRLMNTGEPSDAPAAVEALDRYRVQAAGDR